MSIELAMDAVPVLASLLMGFWVWTMKREVGRIDALAQTVNDQALLIESLKGELRTKISSEDLRHILREELEPLREEIHDFTSRLVRIETLSSVVHPGTLPNGRG